MKKNLILIIALAAGSIAFAQKQPTRDYNTLHGFSWGLGVPFEMRDLPGAGITLNLGYDRTYPIQDNFAMGFYITGGGGLWSEYKRYSNVDNNHFTFRLTAGLMMAIGDNDKRPFLIGVAPCTGLGLYDTDIVLPLELRFGRYITDRWYIMGEITYHYSLSRETSTIEPAIRVGYNFGRKIKKP